LLYAERKRRNVTRMLMIFHKPEDLSVHSDTSQQPLPACGRNVHSLLSRPGTAPRHQLVLKRLEWCAAKLADERREEAEHEGKQRNDGKGKGVE
jgi:hypothetical protein